MFIVRFLGQIIVLKSQTVVVTTLYLLKLSGLCLSQLFSDISVQCVKVSLRGGMCWECILTLGVGWDLHLCSATASELLLPGSTYFVKHGNQRFILLLHVRLGSTCGSCLQGNKMCNFIHRGVVNCFGRDTGY